MDEADEVCVEQYSGSDRVLHSTDAMFVDLPVDHTRDPMYSLHGPIANAQKPFCSVPVIVM